MEWGIVSFFNVVDNVGVAFGILDGQKFPLFRINLGLGLGHLHGMSLTVVITTLSSASNPFQRSYPCSACILTFYVIVRPHCNCCK